MIQASFCLLIKDRVNVFSTKHKNVFCTNLGNKKQVAWKTYSIRCTVVRCRVVEVTVVEVIERRKRYINVH